MSLKLYRVYVPFYVEAEVEVVAEDEGEAKEIAQSICQGDEYANDTVGVSIEEQNPYYPEYENELKNLTIGDSDDPTYAEELEEVEEEEDEEEYE